MSSKHRSPQPHMAQPVSVTITPQQLEWLDARRTAGSLSRSAVLRIILDDAIVAERRRRRPAAAQTANGSN